MTGPRLRLTPGRIAGLYLLVGASWILVSDRFAHTYVAAATKGVAYVVVTALLLLVLLRRYRDEVAAGRRMAEEIGARFKTLVESAPTGIFIQTEGQFRYLNPAALRLFGATDPSQLAGARVEDRLHPDSRARLLESFHRMRRDGTPVAAADERCLTLDGRSIECEISAIPFHQEGEAGALVYVSDISARLVRERLFKEVAEAIPAQIWTAADNGAVLYMNDRCYSYAGWRRGEFDPGRWMEAVHPEDSARVLQAWRESRRSGTPYSVRLRLRRYDGAYRWHLARALPMSDSAGKITWFGINTDIDDATRLMEHLEAAAENERVRLSRELHDDLGQLLAAAKLHVELALRGSPNLHETLGKARDNLVECMQRTRNMATMMRPAVLEHGGLGAALRALASDFEASCQVPCSVRIDAVPAKLPHPVALAIYRVAQEALNNVAKHAKATSVSVELGGADSSLQLRVCDNGHGFEALESARARGLGLIGMSERATGIGATLSVESTGAGTRVQMDVPLSPAGPC